MPDGNAQKATVCYIIMTLILFISLINAPAASWFGRKKVIENADKFKMKKIFLDMNAVVVLITSLQEPVVTASLSFLNESGG